MMNCFQTFPSNFNLRHYRLASINGHVNPSIARIAVAPNQSGQGRVLQVEPQGCCRLNPG